MAQVKGTLMTVFLDTDLILSSTDCTLNVNLSAEATTNKESGGWVENIVGVKDWSIDFSGMFDDATAGGVGTDELMAFLIAQTAPSTMKFGTSADAATGWTGSGLVTNVTIEAGTETPATFSGSIIGSTALAAI